MAAQSDEDRLIEIGKYQHLDGLKKEMNDADQFRSDDIIPPRLPLAVCQSGHVFGFTNRFRVDQADESMSWLRKNAVTHFFLVQWHQRALMDSDGGGKDFLIASWCLNLRPRRRTDQMERPNECTYASQFTYIPESRNRDAISDW